MLTNNGVCGWSRSIAKSTYTPCTTRNLKSTETPLTTEVFRQKTGGS